MIIRVNNKSNKSHVKKMTTLGQKVNGSHLNLDGSLTRDPTAKYTTVHGVFSQ